MARLFASLAFLIVMVAAAPPAGSQEPVAAGDGLASAAIVGQVVAADSGAPIRGAQVRLRASAGNDVRLALTDERGRFEARNLFSGSWQVSASKNGFVTTRYGARRATDEGKAIAVSAGQGVTIAIALPRAGAITGRVFDEFGEPLLGARVQAMRSKVVQGMRQLAPVGASDTTDDTGAFRLFGLTPGTYYVNAMLRASTPDTDPGQGTLGAMTYYAGTADVGEAQPVVLRAGEEPNIAFQVAPIRSVRISGVLYGSNGAPAADTEVRLLRLDATQVGTTVGNFGRSRSDGSFTIINVPPGPYVLFASRTSLLRAQPGPQTVTPFEEVMANVIVGVEDVSGVTLAMATGTTVTGTIVAESGSSLPSPLQLEIVARPAIAMGRSPAIIQVNRARGEPTTFRIPGMLGALTLDANLPDGVMLAAIEANGVDVTDRPIELRGPSPDIRVVLTTRVTEVTGAVTDGRSPVANVSVVVFPEDRDKWNFPSRYVTFTDVDDQGRFLIRRLPAGERYFAAVVPLLEDGEQYDAELLNALRDRAVPFTLGDGERRTVNLTR